MKLLCYGTLKRGSWNHPRLGHSSHYLGEASFTGNLYWNGPGGIPFAKVEKEGIVHGELYEVPSTRIESLDSLEGHPIWYKRTYVRLHDGREAIVYIYQGSVEGLSKVPDGRYPVQKPSWASEHRPSEVTSTP